MTSPAPTPSGGHQRLALQTNARRRQFSCLSKGPAPVTSKPAAHSGPGSLWATMEKKHMELELQSLREAYARKIADTELQCEKKMEAAEADRNEWFKKKKVEIAKIRAGVIVMQALFERRKRKFISQMEQEREQTAKQRKEMDEKMAAMEQQLAETTADYEHRLAEMEASHAKKLVDLDKMQRETEERALRADRALHIAEGEITRLTDVEKELRFEIEDMKVRLQVAERAEELQRVREKTEFLEEELRRLRKRMADRKHAEAEALRKELMAYVEFIVKILPGEWRTRVKPEILQRLAAKHAGDHGELLVGPSSPAGVSEIPELPPLEADRAVHRGTLA